MVGAQQRLTRLRWWNRGSFKPQCRRCRLALSALGQKRTNGSACLSEASLTPAEHGGYLARLARFRRPKGEPPLHLLKIPAASDRIGWLFWAVVACHFRLKGRVDPAGGVVFRTGADKVAGDAKVDQLLGPADGLR